MKKIKIMFSAAMLLIVASLSTAAYAVNDPVASVQKTSDQVISALVAAKKSDSISQAEVYSIVKRYLLPKVAVATMSRYAVGGTMWDSASAAQRTAFSSQFTKLVIGTYASAFAQYNNQKIKVYPLRGGYAGKKTVQVNSVITQGSGPDVPVNYRLILSGSNWLLYDFVVDGISMIQSFRSQFMAMGHNSLPNLTAALKAHSAGKK
jgi:phospholipid transport system substrate-binding protein